MGRSQVFVPVQATKLPSNDDTSVSQSEWTAEFEFRATGPERGSGNLHIWYTKDGPSALTTASIYTVGFFDGFVLVIDPYGGKVRKTLYSLVQGYR